MKRFKHSLSNYRLATFDMGQLVPVNCFEVLPGDTVDASSAALLRVSPLVAPVMHPVGVRIHHWFVPYRLLWSGWEDFITGGSDGEGGSSGAFPQFTSGTVAAGDLGDYLGLPVGLDFSNIAVSKLPYRAYNLIYNEFYRDQDLVSAVSEDADDVQLIAWEKDRFTGARPWPQKGPDVTLPLGTSADVNLVSATGTAGIVRQASDHALMGGVAGLQTAGTGGIFESSSGGTDAVYDPNGTLYADLATATAVNVNDVRRAFAIQRYQEARAQYGSRYTEYLRYLGVRSSDARLQRPEYLGGGKQTIAFTEVLQTGPDTSDEGVADLKGHGISAVRSRRYRRYFEEHGVVLSLMSVRPRTLYCNGVERFWSRETKEEFWQKELELIGQEEVYNKELYYADSGPDDVFGYQDRYSDYRSKPSGVSGDFRSTLNFWHLGRIFAGDVTLNQSFVECAPSKRIHAVQTDDVLWVMVQNQVRARRMVRKSSIGAIY